MPIIPFKINDMYFPTKKEAIIFLLEKSNLSGIEIARVTNTSKGYVTNVNQKRSKSKRKRKPIRRNISVPNSFRIRGKK